MSTGKIQVYYGEGKGKTSAALGYAIHEASKGESVIVIQFLKRKMRMKSVSLDVLNRKFVCSVFRNQKNIIMSCRKKSSWKNR